MDKKIEELSRELADLKYEYAKYREYGEGLEKNLADLKKILREMYTYCTTNYIMPDWKGTPLGKLKQAIGEEVK